MTVKLIFFLSSLRFVYGKVSKQSKKQPCYFDSTNTHFYVDSRVEYPDVNGRSMYKSQPSNLLGQLPKQIKTINNVSTTQTRELGSPASLRDLSNIAFNNLHKFSIGEIVLVTRSSGGFTYGEIICPVKVPCLLPLDKKERHEGNLLFHFDFLLFY